MFENSIYQGLGLSEFNIKNMDFYKIKNILKKIIMINVNNIQPVMITKYLKFIEILSTNTNIEPYIRFNHIINTDTCGWVKVTDYEVEDKDKKKLTLSTIFVLRGEQNVNSKDKDGKTITTKKPAVVFVANLPLNVDLTIKPQMQIDGKKVIDLTLTNCNQNDGCKAIGSLNNDSIEKMKKGKILSVITRSFGSAQNIKIDFPLKDFDSEFKKI
jgi:invasion protein IalB